MKLIVSNNTGHNFPSGTSFPRQLWLEVFAIVNTDTIFASGMLYLSAISFNILDALKYIFMNVFVSFDKPNDFILY